MIRRKLLIVTMKNTMEPVARYLIAFDHVGRYGSLSLVTGLIRKVFTDVSNSGLGSSSYSAFWRSHSQTITACRRFQSSRNVVAVTAECQISLTTTDTIEMKIFSTLKDYTFSRECILLYFSRVLPQKDIKIAKKTVAGLSNK